jgi:hypothetical protein
VEAGAVGGIRLGVGIPDVVVAGKLVGEAVRAPDDKPGVGRVAVVEFCEGVDLVVSGVDLGVVGRLKVELPSEGVAAVTGVGRTQR